MASLKIGLVLGGGGARGLAHIGVLKVLEKNNIPIHVITGTSMGALIGALYAQHPDAEWVENRVQQFLNSDVFRRSGGNVFKQHRADYEPEDVLRQLSHRIKKRIVINLAAHRISLMKGERLQLAIDELIDDGKIEDTKIPFACASTDLRYGETVVFTNGSLRYALRASAAIPGFIPPVAQNGRLLIDGSVCNNFPVEAARMLGANFIIASDVMLDVDPKIELKNVIDIVIRSNMVSTNAVNSLLLEKVEHVIRPQTGKTHWSDFEDFDSLFRKGYDAAHEEIEKIKLHISRRNSLTGRVKYWLYNWIKNWYLNGI